ncbi:hypothetical protein [Novosphingobium sp.]|uniref:hypothetical protein n=1 Tax=Novosphingobium sp. TaxID=1874826 RepID=UPI00286CCE61|nr:hypothetical protein [Novosphingobium sp.]
MKIRTMIIAALSTAVVPVAVPLPAYTAAANANQCMDQDQRLVQVVNLNKPPQSASTIVQLTNLLYVLDAALSTLDRLCADEPDFQMVRGDYQNVRDQTYKTCTQLATSESVCRPVPYTQAY